MNDSGYENIQNFPSCSNDIKSTYKNEIAIVKENIQRVNKKVDNKSLWFVVELGESYTFTENSDIVEDKIKQIYGDREYFVPMYKEKIKEEVAVFILFDGYFFIRADNEIYNNPSEFKDEYVIKGIMRKNKKIEMINGTALNDMKKELWEEFKKNFPKKDQRVVPKIGMFGGLEGTVIDVDKENFTANVYFTYKSIKIEAPISFINITLISNNKKSIS